MTHHLDELMRLADALGAAMVDLETAIRWDGAKERAEAACDIEAARTALRTAIAKALDEARGAVPLPEPYRPNESGSTPVLARWVVETPAGWLAAYDKEAFGAYASAARGAPPGWQLVPVEPTPTMISEGSCTQSLPGPHYISDAAAKQCWTAMLAAAPTQPAIAGKEQP
jgi:hypothetical protein